MAHPRFPHCGLCRPQMLCTRHAKIVKTILDTERKKKRERER